MPGSLVHVELLLKASRGCVWPLKLSEQGKVFAKGVCHRV